MVEDDVSTVPLAAALVPDFDNLACECGDDSAVFSVAEPEIDSAVHAVLARSVVACYAAALRRDDRRRHVENEQLGWCASRG